MKIPKLRFKPKNGGIFPAWSEKTLAELTDVFKSGQGITSNRIRAEGEYPVYGGNGLRGYAEEFTHDGYYALIGRQGALCGNINTVNGKTFISEHAIAVKATQDSSTEWLAIKLELMNLNRLSESSAQPGLAVNKLLKLKVNSPCIEEQEKIAAFIGDIDQKISLLSKKHELLIQYKKGVMQKIFNQEIRFKDKNGKNFPESKRVFLGDIAQFYKGKGISKSDISSDGLTPCIRYGELYTQYGVTIGEVISKTNTPIKDLILSKANDVIIPASGETQIDIATASCVIHGGIALGGDLNIIRTEQSGVFLCYYLNSEKKLDIAKLAQGNSVVHLYASQLKGLEIELPTLAEQELIANFLSLIDKKIALCNAELIATKKYKQGLLQQMFV